MSDRLVYFHKRSLTFVYVKKVVDEDEPGCSQSQDADLNNTNLIEECGKCPQKTTYKVDMSYSSVRTSSYIKDKRMNNRKNADIATIVRTAQLMDNDAFIPQL